MKKSDSYPYLCYAYSMETINQKNDLLAAIVESSNDAILTKGLDGTILSWNKSAEKMYGYAKDEIVGQNISVLLPANKKNESMDILDKIKHGQKIENFETVRVTKDGTEVDVSVSISGIKDNNGKIQMAATIARDITISKKSERKLLDSAKDLQKLNEMMVDRELKMVELKKEIAQLKAKK